MDKKGQGEQFNWIFVIVAGAIILSFFTVFTVKYIQLQESRQNAELGRTFGENIQLLEASGIESYFIDDSSFKLGVTVQFDYFCLENESIVRFNNDGHSTQSIQDEIVFAPTKTRLNSFDAWIKSWDYPYYIVNMIYLSEPTRDYILVSDVTTREFVRELDIPIIYNSEKIDKNTPIESDGATKVTVMYFTRPSPGDFEQIQEQYKESLVLYVDLEREEITFFDEDGRPDLKVPYYGESLLLGAMFSAGAEEYECSLNRALTRLGRTTNVYNTKALLLERSVADPACRYSGIQQSLREYPGQLERNGGAELRRTLTDQNEGLGGQGCPTVF